MRHHAGAQAATVWPSGERYESALGFARMRPSTYDDRVGRCLDALFLADRATLMTEIVVHAVEEFDLQLPELHNDSTTVTFTGQYSQADGTPARGRASDYVRRKIIALI